MDNSQTARSDKSTNSKTIMTATIAPPLSKAAARDTTVFGGDC
jgi:hypothetical protein